MGVGQHFRTHGAIHAFWIISILVSIIAALALLVPNGTLLRDYISFASSISSIILAVIAIFYSMFSNQSFSEMVGSLRSSVQTTEKSSASLAEASEFLTLLADRVSGEISSLVPRFDAVESKIEKGLSPDRVSAKSETGQPKGDIPKGEHIITSGLAVALYAIQMMSKYDKLFDAKLAFDTVVWQQYVGGCLSSISYFSPFGIVINRGQGFNYNLMSLGDLTSEKLNEMIERSKPNSKMKEAVDKYFNGQEI